MCFIGWGTQTYKVKEKSFVVIVDVVVVNVIEFESLWSAFFAMVKGICLNGYHATVSDAII